MNGQKVFQRLIWGGLAVLLLVGCGSPSEEQLVITFDGNECVVSGPSELAVGEQPIILKNTTEKNLTLGFNQFLDGHTYQDLVDHLNQLGGKADISGSDRPDWVNFRATSFMGYEKGETTGEEIITLYIKNEGDHGIELYEIATETVWLCGPIEVVEAPPE